MAWSGGNFTRANPTWVADAGAGIGIEAGRHDAQDNDFTTGINQCLNKDGSNSATGNLNIGGFKVSNMATGTASGDATTLGQIQAGVNTQSTTLAVTNTRFSADTTGAQLYLRKSRGAAVGTNTIVTSGDQLGGIYFSGANGTGYDAAAAINGYSDATPGASGDMPGSLRFFTCADGSATLTERMRIDSSGRVGIATATPFSNLDTPTFQIGVSGTAANNFHFTAGSSELTFWNGNYGAGSYLGTLKSTGFLGLGVAPSYRLQLSTDSAAKPTTNTWTISSDARIKTNIEPYQKGLAEICQVNPITYDYNGKGGIPAGPGGVSILAQELQPIFPECIGSYKAKLNDDDAEETEILNYNGHAITFALINAVKELNAKVVALEAKVAALES